MVDRMSDIVWSPNKEYIENSNIKRFMDKYDIKSYEELIRKSTDNIEWFWDSVVKDLNIEWFKPYETILDLSNGISWAKWFIAGKLNIVHNCIDRHAKSEYKDKSACIWESENGEIRNLSYSDLYHQVNSLSKSLKLLGIKKGDRIGMYMPMIPEIIIALYACMKIGAICIPVFSGFGSGALSSRLEDCGAKILITADGSSRRGKRIEIKREADLAVDQVASIKHVIVCKRLGITIPWKNGRDIWWHNLVTNQPEEFPTEWMDSEDLSLILYSSGTTGKPKGTVHTHAGCITQICKEVAYYFDVKKKDVFFWLTDIGWMMGPWMIIGVHSLGGTVLLYEGAPDYPAPDILWNLVDKYKITIFGISPTAVRLLIKYGDEWINKYNLRSLRILGSTGEPWDTESWMWYFNNVGRSKLPIINISGGTEIVGCLLSPLPLTSLKPCTLRGPGLGMDVDVFNEYGKSVRGLKGHLVIKKPAPSMTKGFWKDPERYLDAYWSKWPNVWYHGDWASVDEDGFWFLHGRSDDTIKVSGRRVGPAEIEEALMKHSAVFESAVIGIPHQIRGEGIVCFVVLKPNNIPSEQLKGELKEKVVEIMGKTLRPEEVKFVKDLPKTRTAKIVRRLVKARYLGEKIEDVSSIENPHSIDEIDKAI